MNDVRHDLSVCPDCGGDGWYAGHDQSDPHMDGVCTNCPVQIQCERCDATGFIWVKDLKPKK